MTALTFSGFKGAIPKLAPKSLSEGYAQQADNCCLETGQLRPKQANLHIRALPHALEARTIYNFQGNWLAWSGDVDVVRSPLDSEHIFYSGDGFPKQATLDQATSDDEGGYPGEYRRLGVLPPPSGNTLTITRDPATGSGDVLRSVSYVYTLVTDQGEESAPSAPSGVVDVYEDQTVTLDNFGYQSGTLNEYTHYRIYRLNTGTSLAEYQFVDEISYTNESYEDSKDNADLGEVLPTTGWDAPVGGLQGLGQFVQGILLGFLGKDLYFFEPWIPYAAPAEYSLSVNEAIVGWGYVDETIVVLSESRPYLVTGSDPQSMSMQPLPYDIGCVSKRSICSTPFGVVFASLEGLFLVASGVPRNISEALYTQRQWARLGPADIITAWHNHRLYIFWEGGEQAVILDMDQEYVTALDLSNPVYAVHKDSPKDILYLLLYDESAGYQIYSLEQSVQYSEYTYKTREVTFQRPVSFSTGQVYGDFHIVFVEGVYVAGVFQEESTLKIYAGKDLIYTKTLDGTSPFRLPAAGGFKAYELVVSGGLRIDALSLATSPAELMT